MRLNLSLNKFLRPIKYLVSLVLAIGIFLALLYSNQWLAVTEIKITGIDQTVTIFGLNNYRNKNLLLLSAKDLTDDLKQQNPMISNIDLTKNYPHTLNLNISLYMPLAVLDNRGDFLFISSDGRILYKNLQNSTSLPVINYYQKLNQYSYTVGDRITYADIVSALHFISSMSDLGLVTERVDINGTDMILCNTDTKQIIFTTEKRQDLQDYELGEIVRQFKIEGKQFKSLDLRFEKPVVKF